MDSAEAMAEWANDINDQLFALNMAVGVLFSGMCQLSPETAVELAAHLRRCSAGAMQPGAAACIEALAAEWAAVVGQAGEPT